MRKNLVSYAASLALATWFGAGASGAVLEVGPGKRFAKPCDAFRAAGAGDTVEISGSVYEGDVCVITTPNITVKGVVTPRPHIKAGGVSAEQKGIWVIRNTVRNFTVEGIEFSGASVPDRNGAGIRSDPDLTLTIRDCHFHDNEMGILTADSRASDVTIENSIFEDNGFNDPAGQAHNVYVNGTRRLTFRGNYSRRSKVGQLLKSRASENYILYNRLTQENGTGSREIDISNGGLTYVIGNIIEQGPQSQNANMVGYAAEGFDQFHPSTQLYVVNNTFVNRMPGRSDFIWVNPAATAKAVIRNNIFSGGGTIVNQADADQAGNYIGDGGFTNPSGYDFTLRAGSGAIDAGIDPGSGPNFSLRATTQYRHPACGSARTFLRQPDAGAYEFGADSGQPEGPARCRAAFSPVAVANGASFTGDALTPGMIASVFGTDFSQDLLQATAAPLPFQLGDVRVSVNAVPAPLYFVSRGQVNFQIPWGLDLGDATVQISVAGVAKPAANVKLQAAAPGIFLFDGDRAVAQNQDFTLNTAANGAPPGAFVTVYLTGQGQLSRFLATGAATPPFPLHEATLPRSASIGGREAEVAFLGLTPGLVGVAQANIRIPEGLPPGNHPLTLTVGGAASNAARITVAANVQ